MAATYIDGLWSGRSAASHGMRVTDHRTVSAVTVWNTEVGYGAVAFDGTVLMNERLVAGKHLDRDEIQMDTERNPVKGIAPLASICAGSRSVPDVAGRTVIVIDDGIASGFTLRTASGLDVR